MDKINETESKNIIYKIHEAKKISYFENDLSDLGLPNKKINNSLVDYNVSFKIDDEKSLIQIKFSAKFYLKKNKKKFDLFGIDTLHGFKIKNFNKSIKRDNNSYRIPDILMLTFLNLSVSGSRGMLAILNSKYEYCDILFPIVSTIDLLNKLKPPKK
ncbi:MAG: hypothetical protein H8E22_08240 [Candidatus Cloacimonetes bacterium]|nr:hypothetical protein [Candidatus Cloacimonadota bacterium]